MFSCEFCEICKNTFSIEHLRWLFLFLQHVEVIINQKLIRAWKIQRLAFVGVAYVLRLISKTFITMKVSLGVPLLDLCLVKVATQLSKLPQFIFITNVF